MTQPVLLCWEGSPLVPYQDCKEEIVKELAVTAGPAQEDKLIADYLKAIESHAWRLIVGKYARAGADKQFIETAVEQERQVKKALEGRDGSDKAQTPPEVAAAVLPASRFAKFAGRNAATKPVELSTLATLAVVLSPQCMQYLNDCKHGKRFLATPLPEPYESVSKTLGIPKEQVEAGTRKSDLFDYSRLLRSFGNSFIADKLPKHSYALLPVSSPLYGYSCNQANKDCLPFYMVFVDDAAWDGRTPYDKVYREGTRYYLQVRLDELVARVADALSEVTQRAGDHDDLV